VSLGVGVGIVASSRLVRDSIVDALTVRPQLAPQVQVRVEAALTPRYDVAGDVSVSRSSLMAIGTGESTRITTLTLWSPGVTLRARATSWLGAEARLGVLIYDPGATEGTLFADGSPVTPQVGVGLRAERALGAALAGTLHMRYDVHRFTTNSLKARGFTGETLVHRVAVGVTLYRKLSHAPPPE
jgi:hypothetical protein